ncbi:uncharacterized protein LOC141667813 isoform X2 [Apium graveolens]|uniref:uncharacterized protein LOC141667813 isoform X2 n=1 Tax=Apium graveolens TaxID=4045 RepID=UPI003D794079
MKKFSRKSDIISEASREWDSEEGKLELRLGPPGEEDWAIKTNDPSALHSLGHMNNASNKGFFLATDSQENTWINIENHHNLSTSSSSSEYNTQVLGNTIALSPWSTSASSQYKQSLPPAMGKESLQIKDYGSHKVMVELQNAENKGFSLSSAENTAVVTNNSQKRIAPVVGWPPIRSFRKNRAIACASKLSVQSEARNEVSEKIASKQQNHSSQKGLFVKINMDGVPIGRKVNLNAYDSYGKLSSAVDELFRGLLAANMKMGRRLLQEC